MATKKELLEKRASLIQQMKELNDKAHNEKRSLTTEENAQWDKMYEDSENLKREADRLEKLYTLEAEEARAKGENPENRGQVSPEERKAKTNEAFMAYLRYGYAGVPKELRSYLTVAELDQRAQSTTNSEGGYTIAPLLGDKIIEQLKAFGGMRQAGFVFQTATGASLPFATNDDTSNVGAIISENGDASSSVTDLTMGTRAIGSYTYTSKVIKISKQLIQDSAFDITDFVSRKLAERVGRIQNTHFTTGDGSSKPYGLITEASAGVTAASQTAITADEIIDLQHSVDPAYRTNPGVGFMFHDSVFKAVRKLKDSEGRYLWQMGDIRTGAPDTLLGKPYFINQDMTSSIAASAKTIAFGDFKQYLS